MFQFPRSLCPVLVVALLATAVADAQNQREDQTRERPRVTKEALLDLYDLSDARIDIDDLLAPGMPQDGIPPLTDPKFENASEAAFPPEEARVAVVTINEETRAYPLLILNFHEIVNHTVGGRPIAVLYCPLCDSVSVVDRTLDRGDDKDPLLLEFGVSGFLHHSNVVMYDRQTNSLWSQVFAQAVTGPHAGSTLRHLPFEMMRFAEFRAKHPDGAVLSRETGHQRPYDVNRYERYFKSDRIFHAFDFGDELPPKTLGMGIRADDFTAFVTQRRAKERRVTVETPHGKVILSANESGFVIHESPETVQTVQTFFHSWSAFFRDTQIMASEDERATE